MNKCRVLTCELRSDKEIHKKEIIPLDGTPCGYNSVRIFKIVLFYVDNKTYDIVVLKIKV